MPHQLRTRMYVSETIRMRSNSDETAGKSTEPKDILPLITVWLQVQVLRVIKQISGLLGSTLQRRDIAPEASAFVPELAKTNRGRPPTHQRRESSAIQHVRGQF